MTTHGFRRRFQPGPPDVLSGEGQAHSRFEIESRTEGLPSSYPTPRVLLLLEGFVDIRLLMLLSRICRMTVVTPLENFYTSELNFRIRSAGLDLPVHIIPGDRIEFQWRSLKLLLRIGHRFDLLLAQENLRGALNVNIAGQLLRKPVLTYTGIPPVEYFRCRHERGQISWPVSLAGQTFIRFLLALNGRMATRCLAVGPYLATQTRRHSRSVTMCQAHGVDTTLFHPVSSRRKLRLRKANNLPVDGFIVFFASRISHEKDVETFLQAVALLRESGLPAYALSCSGNPGAILQTADDLNLSNWHQWLIARPALNPLTRLNQIYQCADAVAQTSLESGLSISTLEALSSGIPAAVTATGGMKYHIRNYARLIPRRDPEALARELMWIHEFPQTARKLALRGRRYVQNSWSTAIASTTFKQAFAELVNSPSGSAPLPDPQESRNKNHSH
jgi:glycosyltransferase involved in cell wall biosynthesis